MSLSGIRTLSLLLLAAPGLLACRQNPLVKPANPAPKAVAKATLGQTPGTILLDGSMSTDDGPIAKYQWRSGTRRPDGMGRLIPSGIMTTAWPGDGQVVMVSQLPDGCWTFDLWVTDTLGATSDPVTTTPIAVGNATCPSTAGTGGGAAGAVAGGGGASGGGAVGGGAGGAMAGAGGQ